MYFPRVLRPRPILFDLGDTLINFSATDPLPMLREGTQLAYAYMHECGIKLPSFETYFRACRRCTYWAYFLSEISRRELQPIHTLRRLHRRLHLPHDDTFLHGVAGGFYAPIKVLGAVEENIHPVLDKLKKDEHPMGIVSNTMVPGPLLDQHLEEFDLLKYFPVRVYSCDVGVRKPNLRMFRAALRQLNIKPQGTLFVGDKAHLDIKGALRMGMTGVLKVRNGRMPRSRHHPHFVVRHLTELPALMEKIGPMQYETAPLNSARSSA